MPDRIAIYSSRDGRKKGAFPRQLVNLAAAKVAVALLLSALLLPGGVAAAPQPATLSASDLTQLIEETVRGETRGWQDRVTVEIALPAEITQLPPCAVAQPELPAGQRLWGRISIPLRCLAPNPWQIHVPVVVRRFGRFVVSARPLRHRDPLAADDLQVTEGELTTLPDDLIRTPDEAVGKILRVSVAAGQPLRAGWLAAPTVIRNGQPVTVIQEGEGFRIETEGYAMNSAAVGEGVRVRLPNRQVVEGVANGAGSVVIPSRNSSPNR
jgi:flagella basal body P-ring formation protein FlgA